MSNLRGRMAIAYTNGWAGRGEHRCIIAGETPKRYRVVFGSEVRMRSRIIPAGVEVLIPKRAVHIPPLPRNCDDTFC